MGLPILSAHLLKTAMATFEEGRVCGRVCKKYLYAALKRFFSSSIKEKHVRRQVRQGIALVAKDF